MTVMSFIVIAREDRKDDGEPGDYSLATRGVFQRRSEAEAYAKGISESRAPIVVEGRFQDLRSAADWQPRHIQGCGTERRGCMPGCSEYDPKYDFVPGDPVAT